jgi:NADH:ubiquinone oxidoreductase subunit 3 (subunit A)
MEKIIIVLIIGIIISLSCLLFAVYSLIKAMEQARYYKYMAKTFESGYDAIKSNHDEAVKELTFLYVECDLGRTITERLGKLLKKIKK